jgi:hypothetical protein
MEDVLEVFARPCDPARPLVCMDEMPEQFLADARPPLPGRPGGPACVEYGYERRRTANLFVFCEPLAGHRWVDVTDRCTAVD